MPRCQSAIRNHARGQMCTAHCQKRVSSNYSCNLQQQEMIPDNISKKCTVKASGGNLGESTQMSTTCHIKIWSRKSAVLLQVITSSKKHICYCAMQQPCDCSQTPQKKRSGRLESHNVRFKQTQAMARFACMQMLLSGVLIILSLCRSNKYLSVHSAII